MNVRSILKTVAALQLVIVGCMAACALLALVLGEPEQVAAFLVPAAFVGLLSATVLAGLRHVAREVLLTREGFLFVTLGWISVSLSGSLPFVLSGAIPDYADAFFESMSGFTTTGATILTDIEALPRSILFWRSLMQWLGGMGIVVLTVAILPRMGIGGLKVLRSEAPGPTVDKLTPRIAQTAKILWLMYVGMSALEVALLMLAGMQPLDAVMHTFSTVAIGGFSPRNDSVGSFQSGWVDVVVIVFMLAAGVNFSLYFRLGRGGLRVLVSNVEFRVYLAIAAAAVLVVTLILYGRVYDSVIDSLRYGAFQVVSILTTTGFTTADYGGWPEFAKAILMALMFVGGCAGSTAGGIKVVRIITLFKLAANELRYLIHPRGVFPTRVTEQPLKKDILHPIVTFFFLYIAILIVTMLVVASAGTDLLSSFSTALSTVGNIGPGFGAIGPVENYGHYPAGVKLFLCLAMLTGRLELYSVVVLLTPAFWRK